MQVVLRIVNSKSNVRQLRLKSETTTIGRGAGCQLKVVSDQISRRHCQIVIRDERVTIQDLGSVNGTYVDGQQIPPHSDVALESGTRVELGSLQFVVEILSNETPLAGPEASGILSHDAVAIESNATTNFNTTREFNEVAPANHLDSNNISEIAAIDLAQHAEVNQPRVDDAVDLLPAEMARLPVAPAVAPASIPQVLESGEITSAEMTREVPLAACPPMATEAAILSQMEPDVPPAPLTELAGPAGSVAPAELSGPPIPSALMTNDGEPASVGEPDTIDAFAPFNHSANEPESTGLVPQLTVPDPSPVSSPVSVPSEELSDSTADAVVVSNQVQFEDLMLELAPLSISKSHEEVQDVEGAGDETALDRTSNTLFASEATESIVSTATASSDPSLNGCPDDDASHFVTAAALGPVIPVVVADSNGPIPTPVEPRPVKRSLVPILNVKRNQQQPDLGTSSGRPSRNEPVPPIVNSIAFPKSGHLLGIGCATNRVGYSVSNSDQTIASLIENSSQNDTVDARRVTKLVSDYHIVGLVVGTPIIKSGDETPKSLECHQLGESLSKLTGLPVAFASDGSSSRFAAQVMLQRFLDLRNAEKSKGPATTRILTEC